MKISTRGSYALRIMTELAMCNPEEFVSIRYLSEKQGLSLKYLEQIVGLLNKAGLLTVARGANGGYKLAREPENYTLGEILRCTEGNLAPVSCLEKGKECAKSTTCLTLPVWKGLYSVINNYLDSITLDTLVKQQNSL